MNLRYSITGLLFFFLNSWHGNKLFSLNKRWKRIIMKKCASLFFVLEKYIYTKRERIANGIHTHRMKLCVLWKKSRVEKKSKYQLFFIFYFSASTARHVCLEGKFNKAWFGSCAKKKNFFLLDSNLPFFLSSSIELHHFFSPRLFYRSEFI